MSERAPQHEQHEYEAHPYGERPPVSPEHSHDQRKKTPETSQESIDKLLKKIEREAKSSREITGEKVEHSQHEQDSRRLVGSHLKSHGQQHTLAAAQKQLKPVERTFSKIIHNPTIETASTAFGASFARPSGLLSGGIFSVIGSLLILMISRFYGYEYNFLIGVVFFVGGFVIGIIVEMLFKLRRH